MSSAKTNYKSLSEVLLSYLTSNGLRETIRQRHPTLSLQGNKRELQTRLAVAEGLSLAAVLGPATAPRAPAKPVSTGNNKLPPGVTGIHDIDSRVDDLIGSFNASRMGKTKNAGLSISAASGKKSHKCTSCGKRYKSKAHDVSDLTEGICRKCALDEGLIMDCDFCKRRNVPEIMVAWCDGCDKTGCIHHFPGNATYCYHVNKIDTSP